MILFNETFLTLPLRRQHSWLITQLQLYKVCGENQGRTERKPWSHQDLTDYVPVPVMHQESQGTEEKGYNRHSSVLTNKVTATFYGGCDYKPEGS